MAYTRVTGALAGLLVLLALVLPHEVRELTVAGFARIPVEALLGAALLLLMPPRPRRVLALVAGPALGLLTVLTLLDLGFSAVLDRPFDPLTDWGLLGSASAFLTGAVGAAGAVLAAVLAGLLALAIVTLLTLAVRRLTAVASRRRVATGRLVAALTVVWITCATLGVPVAAAPVYDRVAQVRAGLLDREVFAAELGVDAFRDTPDTELLAGLRGKDIALVVIESYGRDAVEDPEFATEVGAVLADGDRRLGAKGFAARSAFLTSSTSGGGSWLAHSTLLSGLWIDNQQRYHDLEASRRLTLTSAFGRAGWRTVGVMPGVTEPWPAAAFYGYDRVYDFPNLGYRGPNFSWSTTPDQYTLAAFERLERGPGHPPVMAEIPLVSSHAPWFPLPRLVGWDELGDGSVFASMAGEGAAPEAILAKDPTVVRADYRRSIEYSLSSLISYVETYGDDELVLVFLGDHQPAAVVTGEDASKDVPITIVARDPAVLDRLAGWGWNDGLRPGADAPVWRMDAFRDRFLAAFGGS